MPIKAIVTDIEGTTTSISFVKDKLFPYAIEHVEEYLTANWTNVDVQEAVKELRAQYVADVTDKVEGAVAITDGEAKEQIEQIAEVVANVKWQIGIDRKTTSLKKLQGLVWAKGYDSGAIKGHIYPDVTKAFERWTRDNIKIYIYSSGSVTAQKLLFTNSEHGDLSSNISGYFDTNVGMKQDQLSYEKIVKEVGCEPSDILFLTDIVNEAAAAKRSGMKVALLVRSGNSPLTDEDKTEYDIFTSFDDIHSEFVTGKRKLEEIVTAETNAMKIAKLSDDESVTTNDTTTDGVIETNGIDMTDSINDTTMEKMCSNSDELPKHDETVTKHDVKTETTVIPIMQTVCDKTDNLDVGVVEQDIVKGEKDSKPQTEVDDAIKEDEALPMEVVYDKPTEKKEIEDIEMEAPNEAELNKKLKDVNDDELVKVVEMPTDTVEKQIVTDPTTATPEIKSDDQADEAESTEKLSKAEIVDESNSEKRIDIPSQQNGDHKEVIETEKSANETEDTLKVENVVIVSTDTNEPKNVELEKPLESDENVGTIEKDSKEAEEIDNKENIPVEIKEKENVIEIPIHIDGDAQSAQKPSRITTTNGNGVATKDDVLDAVAAATTTNSNKEKMSRIELIIEEKNNDNGQLTETTTHIVKEIIVKNNTCELVDNDKIAENV